MITSAVIWRSECNDIYGVAAFDENVYDFNYATQKLLDSRAILGCGDRFEFAYFEDDDDMDFVDVKDYLNETSENVGRTVDVDTAQIVVAVSHRFFEVE